MSGTKSGLARERAQVGLAPVDRLLHHVARVDEADHRVEADLAEREARVTAAADHLERLLERPLEREELDVDARHDDVPHLELDQPEHVLGELALALRDVPCAGGEREDAAQLLRRGGGVDALVGGKPERRGGSRSRCR